MRSFVESISTKTRSVLFLCFAAISGLGLYFTFGKSIQLLGHVANKEEKKKRTDIEDFLKRKVAPETKRFFYEILRLVSTGDALSFGKDGGELEFALEPFESEAIKKFGDVLNAKITLPDFPISDDSITTHLTILCLYFTLEEEEKSHQVFTPAEFALRYGHHLLVSLIRLYSEDQRDPIQRAWGGMMRRLWEKWPTLDNLPEKSTGFHLVQSFDVRGGGNGGAMHAVPVGLLFSQPHQLDYLIATSLESGRVTHNHPVGFLGSVAISFFTACALQQKRVETWPIELVDLVLPRARKYLVSSGTDLAEYDEGFQYFEKQWLKFIQDLSLRDFKQNKLFQDPQSLNGPIAHDFLKQYAFVFNSESWSGSSGHDVGMYAIFGLLFCGGRYRTFIDIVCNHSGDSDSTGAVSLPLYGVVFGFDQIPANHTNFLERDNMLVELCDVSFPYIQRGASAH